MNTHAKRLYAVFTREELEKLLRIRRIRAGATLLIFEQLRIPIIAYNLEHIPQNVVGWVSHSMPGDNLKMVAQDGMMSYNIELLRRKKKMFSERYKQDSSEKRIREGISLSYQQAGKYISYAISPTRGGVWIFPLANILVGDLFIDFRDTIDGPPEAVLRNRSYYGDATILGAIEKSVQEITKWEEKIQLITQLFTNNTPISIESIGKNRYFSDSIQLLEKLRSEKRFFAFALLLMKEQIYSAPAELTPKFYTFAQGKSPIYLNDTFLRDVDSYYMPGTAQMYTIAHYLILQIASESSRKRDYATYANILDRMAPKDLMKLISRTKRSLIQTMNIIIEILQKGTTPCNIDITKGVLLLDTQYPYNDDAALQKLIDRKIPIFTLLPDFKEVQTEQFLEWFISEVLEMKKREDKITTSSYYVKEGETVQLREWKQ